MSTTNGRERRINFSTCCTIGLTELHTTSGAHLNLSSEQDVSGLSREIVLIVDEVLQREGKKVTLHAFVPIWSFTFPSHYNTPPPPFSYAYKDKDD